MVVGVLQLELSVPEAQSLKDKRRIIKSIKDRLARHNVSVAEVDHQDQWQRAGIGVAVVASSDGHLREILDSVERFVDTSANVEVLDVHTDWIEDKR